MPFETVPLSYQAGASDISHKFLFQDWTLCDQALEILELSACQPLFGRRMCISWCFAPRDQFFNRVIAGSLLPPSSLSTTGSGAPTVSFDQL
jgi:hypothetical protein